MKMSGGKAGKGMRIRMDGKKFTKRIPKPIKPKGKY